MTATLKIKGNRYYAVINYKDGATYKQKWVSLNLPVKNNKRNAEAKLNEIVLRFDPLNERRGTDLIAYIRAWLEKKRPFVELSTWEGYSIYANRHIIPYFEPKKLTVEKVTPKDIQDYYCEKATSGRLDGKPGGLSRAAIIKHAIVLREVFDSAKLDGLIKTNPCANAKIPKILSKPAERKFLSQAEANDLVAAFSGHVLYSLVCITLLYGLRRSEVLGLKWDAIDFQRKTITICRTIVKNLTIEEKERTKNNSSYRTFLLIETAEEILSRVKREQDEYKEKLGDAYIDNGYVFAWPNGEPFRPDFVTKSFEKHLAKMGLPKMRFHDLRHSTSSILYDKGWGLKDIQLWMRHSSIEVTGDIYTHITNDRKAKTADSLNDVLKI